MLPESLVFLLETFRTDIDTGGDNWRRGRLPVRQLVSGGGVIEFLRSVRGAKVWISIGSCSPLERNGREDSRHGMVEMSGYAAVGTVGNDHLRPNLANTLHQVADDFEQLSFGEVPVLIAKNLPMLYAEQTAGVAQFAGAHLRKFSIGLCAAAIARCGPGGQADDADLDPALSIQRERAAEAASFVVRMSGDAKKPRQLGYSPLHRGGHCLSLRLSTNTYAKFHGYKTVSPSEKPDRMKLNDKCEVNSLMH